MEARIHVSYLGLVRNVIGCREEDLEVASGTTVGELLAMPAEKHGDPFRLSVLKGSGELRSMALVCVNDCDITQFEGFETKLRNGEKISVVVGVYPPEGG